MTSAVAFAGLTLLLAYLFGKKWKNERTGRLAAAVLLTSTLFATLIREASGMILAFWLLLALYGGMGILMQRVPEKLQRFAYVFMAGGVGAVLAHNVFSAFFPVSCLLMAAAYTKQGSQLTKIQWLPLIIATAIFMGMGVVWKKTFVMDPFASVPIHPLSGPYSYFLLILLAGFLPWTVFLPAILSVAFRHQAMPVKRDPVKAMLIIWTLGLPVFFMIASPRDLSYLAAVLPPLALLCGDRFDELLEEAATPAWFHRATLWLAAFFVLMVVILKLPRLLPSFHTIPLAKLQANAGVVAFLFSVGTLVIVSNGSRKRTRWSFLGIVFIQVVLLGSCLSIAHGGVAGQDGSDVSEFNLPKLVLPPEPPAGIRLPTVIVRDDEWRGVQCAVTEPRVAVFRHGDRWAAFWSQAMAPFSPKLAKTPGVDFEKYLVIGVFLGEKTTPNFEIEIRKLRIEPRGGKEVLVIRYKEIKKMLGVFSPPFSIQPYHLKRIPAFNGEILFEKM